MALIIQILAQGTISNFSSLSSIYQLNADNRGALVQSIVLSNTSATVAATVTLKLRPADNSANDRYIAPKDLVIPPKGKFVLQADFTMSGTTTRDKIMAQIAASGQAVDYLICGVERDQ